MAAQVIQMIQWLNMWDDAEKNIVAGADTTHDMKKERFGPTTAIINVIPWIVNALKALVNIAVANSYTPWLNGVSNDEISHSNVEDDTVEYFEKNHSVKMRTHLPKIVLTYRTVVDTINAKIVTGIPVPQAIYETNMELANGSDILEIDLDTNENWDINYTSDDKKNISTFMLNFYFPPPTTAAGIQYDHNTRAGTYTYMSFDAGSHFPTKIFGPIENVRNLVTQLNIADSALSSDKHLGGKKDQYLWVFNGANDTWHFTSNKFTAGNTDIYLSRPDNGIPYHKPTKFEFSLHITHPQGIPPYVSNFDAAHTSGPSVAYLAEMIQNISANRNTNIDPTCLNIDDIYDINYLQNPQIQLYFVQLLADLKRGGDAEQAIATKHANEYIFRGRCILSSIDRLCALQSRMMEGNTFYFFATKCILYRFPIDIPIEAKIRQTVDFIKREKVKVVGVLKTMKDTQKHFKKIIEIVKDLYEKITASILLVTVVNLTNILGVIQLYYIKHKIREFVTELYNDNKDTYETKYQDCKTYLYTLTDAELAVTPATDANLQRLYTIVDTIQRHLKELGAADNFFVSLTNFFGESVTPLNMLPFLDNMSTKIDKIAFVKNGSLMNVSIMQYSYKLCQDVAILIDKITRLNGRSLSNTDITIIFKDSLFSSAVFLDCKLPDDLVGYQTNDIFEIVSIDFLNFKKAFGNRMVDQTTEQFNTIVQKIARDVQENLTNVINFSLAVPDANATDVFQIAINIFAGGVKHDGKIGSLRREPITRSLSRKRNLIGTSSVTLRRDPIITRSLSRKRNLIGTNSVTMSTGRRRFQQTVRIVITMTSIVEKFKKFKKKLIFKSFKAIDQNKITEINEGLSKNNEDIELILGRITSEDDIKRNVLNYIYSAIIELIFDIQNSINEEHIFSAFTKFKNTLEQNLYDLYYGYNVIQYIQSVIQPYYSFFFFLFMLFDMVIRGIMTHEIFLQFFNSENRADWEKNLRNFYYMYFYGPIDITDDMINPTFESIIFDLPISLNATQQLIQLLIDNSFENLSLIIIRSIASVNISDNEAYPIPSPATITQVIYSTLIEKICSEIISGLTSHFERQEINIDSIILDALLNTSEGDEIFDEFGNNIEILEKNRSDGEKREKKREKGSRSRSRSRK